MKKIFQIATAVFTANFAMAQAPVVYINFVSHNEPGDLLHTSAKYNPMKTKVLALAAIIDAKGAAWNLETCDGMPTGAYNIEGVSSNVFKTITSGTYADNIEIDPRAKTGVAFLNIADTYWYLDTLGCNPTHTVGGFTYSSNDSVSSTGQINWLTFKDTVAGIGHPWKKWKAKCMWGAGSNPPHTDDLNDWGIFEPDTVSYSNTFNAFYTPNTHPNRDLWYIGNGCQPIQALDTTESIHSILNPLRDFIDSLQNNQLPQNKFYCYSITINQSSFGPTLFSQISAICDTVNAWGTTKIQWKKLTEKFSLFEAWQITSGLPYSQWLCGQIPTSVDEYENMVSNAITVYPNPFSMQATLQAEFPLQNAKLSIVNSFGQQVKEIRNISGTTLTFNRDDLPGGIYLMQLTEGDHLLATKKIIIGD